MGWFVTISVRIRSEDVVDFIEFCLCFRRVTAARCHELPGVLQFVGHLAAGVVGEAPGGEVQFGLGGREASEHKERSREEHGSCWVGAEGDGENFENRCRQVLNGQQTRRFCSFSGRESHAARVSNLTFATYSDMSSVLRTKKPALTSAL